MHAVRAIESPIAKLGTYQLTNERTNKAKQSKMVKFADVPEGSHEKQTTLKKGDLELHLVANADDYVHRYSLAYSVKHLKDYTLKIVEEENGHKLMLSGTHLDNGKEFTIKWGLDPEKVVWYAGVSAHLDQATSMLLIYFPKVHGIDDNITINVQSDMGKTQDEEAELEASFSSGMTGNN